MASLAGKMKLRAGMEATVVNPPQGYLDELQPLPDGVELVGKLDRPFDWIQVFVKNRAELEAQIPAIRQALKPESLLWLTFPKGTSKIQTDLTRDQGWESMQELDLKWTNLISVNETWSAFSLRPFRPGEERKSFR